MNKFERRLFSTDDWFSRHPKLIAAILIAGYVLVSAIQ